MKNIILLTLLTFLFGQGLSQTVTVTKLSGSCSNDSFTFQAATSNFSPSASFTYIWKIDDQTCSTCSSPSSHLFVIPVGSHQSGMVIKCTVVPTVGSGPVSGTSTLTYASSITPLSAGISLDPVRYPPVYCLDEVVFKGTSNSSQATYTWYKNGISMASGLTYDPATLYDGDVIRVVASSTQGCFAPSTAESQFVVGATGNFFKINEPVGTLTMQSLNGPERCQGHGTSTFYAAAENAKYFTWQITPSTAGTVTPSAAGPTSVPGTTAVISWNANYIGTAQVKATAVGCVGQNLSILSFPVHASPTLSNATLQFCEFEPVKLSLSPVGEIVTLKWYNENGEYLGDGVVDQNTKKEGTYTYYAEPVNLYGCVSATRTTVTVQVGPSCDNKLNWVENIAYDDTKEVGHSKSYFDLSGRPLQTQVKNFTRNQVLASQAIADEYERPVISTLAAPLNRSFFQYKHNFATNADGEQYSYQDFEEPFDNTTPGTVGWYYSANNTMEDHVPVTGYPYSRTEFYKDGSGEVRKSGGPGEVHRLGMNREMLSGTFPVYSELDDYETMRETVLGVTGLPETLANLGAQTISRDQNGNYAVSITDKSGKTVMSARKGTSSPTNLSVVNEIEASADPASTLYRPLIYFYLLDNQLVTFSATGDYVIEDIVSDIRYSSVTNVPKQDGKWLSGFYRIVLKSGSVSLTYANHFTDVSYQFYDDVGRLKASISPNGFKQLKESVAYSAIDKTTYKYNFRGWLLEMTEPDAGTTKYQYRRDGKIRFSQNAQQREHEQQQLSGKGKFSYTNYDKLGRPVESGEYIGSALFSSLSSSLELDQQVQYAAILRKDWIVSHYDYADPNFYSQTGLTSSDYVQAFVRGAVSWTENENIRTWYSYDELGRVTWMAQRPTLLNRVFVVEYKYDFSGNVLMASSKAFNLSNVLLSEFYHHYGYDNDMRLDNVYTSLTETGEKKLRAKYEYYLHGPLKRIELGDQLQGIDFIYNIHGWLTQINHPDNTMDPGEDGAEGSDFKKDVFGMLLNYYESEFSDLFEVSSLTPGRNNLHPHSPSIPSAIDELIRPAMVTSADVINHVAQYSPTDYSAAKPLFRELLNHYMADNGISLKDYQADELGSRSYSAEVSSINAVASIGKSSLFLTGTDKRFLIDLGDPTIPTNVTGWNNMTSGLTGAVSSYLVDTDGDTTTLQLEITKNASNGWGNGNYYNYEGYLGVVGDYPESACRDSYFSSGAGGTYTLKGLDPTKYYTIKIFGSRVSSTTYNRIGSYTINGTLKTLGAANNNSSFVYFYNLQPTSSGNIVLDFGVAAGSQLGYINVLDIVQKDAPGIVGPGSSLSAQVVARRGVLTWTDNASNETGYRIERRKEGDTGFQLLVDVAANSNTYTDQTVAVGITYEYKVTAFNASEESIGSNIASILVPGIPDKRYLVDFGNPAFQTKGTGWNNMPSGLTGSVLHNLINTIGDTSAIDIEVLQDARATFTNDQIYYNTIGYNGIVGDYPASACQDNFFSHGNGGSYKLKGLDPTKLYSITIFGSRTGVTNNDRRGTFTVNGVKKVLDASNNSSRTITFYHLAPSSSGELIMHFGVDDNAFLGYMNVWDILEVSNPIVETPSSLAATTIVNGVSLTWTDLASNETGYRIERKLPEETLFKQIAEIAAGASQYTDNSTMTGTQYHYRISAAYGDVNSAYSNVVTITTPGNPPDRRYLIDFGSPSYPTTATGWNNFTSSVTGYTLQNLVDANGNGSTLAVQMVTKASNGFGNGDVFNPDGYNGVVLDYPATACRDSYFAYGPGGSYTLKGLNVNRYYSVKIFGSRAASDAASRQGTYTINGKQYVIDGKNNTTQTITLHNIRPTSSGEIQLAFSPVSPTGFGYMNVMDITETSVPVVLAPTGLSAVVDGRFANLSWLDNASNEAGYTIERRAGTEQIFAVIGTVGANTTQYSDGLLGSGMTYEYRVAAYVAPEVLSPYTNASSVSTPGIPSRRFLMDLGDPATSFQTTTAGWNNMSGGTTGSVLNDMIDAQSGVSTIDFEIIKDASNGYGGGSAAHNSYGSQVALGDYPLNATKDSYFAYGAGGTYKLKGLNPAYYYTITIFGSRQAAAGDLTKIGSYIINGEKQTLNCANNTTNTITFKQLQPNALGEIIFEFGVEAGSQFGYFGVLDFTEYSIPDLNAPALLSTQKLAGTAGVQLTWSDNSLYESGYEIYRATTTATSLYTLVTTTAANVTTYTDATASPGSVYYYRIRATSSKGVSPYSNTLISDNSVDPPVLQALTNQTVNTGGTKTLTLQATPGGGISPTRKNIVIIGSSTAEGTGANTQANSWAGLFNTWLDANYNEGWNLVNLAKAGYTSNELISTGDPERNITKALTYEPVLLIINLPSNDLAANIPTATFMANLTAIKQAAESNGAKVLITTTQPRNFSTLAQREILQAQANEIISTFGASSVSTYFTLAAADKTIATAYAYGDGIHLNNSGHAVVFQAVKAKAEFLLNKTVLSFTSTNAPSFVKIISQGNGQALLEIKPTQGQVGTYAGVTISSVDRNGNYGNQTLDIIVAEADAAPQPGYRVKPLYNGLITSAAWRTTAPGEGVTHIGSPGSDNLKGMYLYEYDDKYQFQDASWAEPDFGTHTFIMQGQKYRVTGMAYDPNGNILKLHRYDGNGIHTNLFDYTYKPNTNQLRDVTGYTTPGGTDSHGYHYNKIGQMVEEYKADGNNQFVDYDVSGKVVAVYAALPKTDANKKVDYLYDDRGFRLAKVSYSLSSGEGGGEVRTTWYIRDASGNILSIYEQEGKPTTANADMITLTEVPVYGSGKLGTYYPVQDGSTVYEITDHLGNVRALVRENVNIYTATMEDNGLVQTANPRVQELVYFENITETAQGNVSQWLNHTEPTSAMPEPDFAALLDGNSGRIIGPATTLRVNAGDKISMKVFGKYEEQSSYNTTTPLTSIIGALSGTYVFTPGLETPQLATQVFTDGFAAIGSYGGSETNRPRAFLNYILFDEDFEYISSDFDRISEDAGFETNQEFTVDFDELSLNVEVQQAGYIYIYLSNETPGVKAWFDDLSVTHTQGLVTQASDYGVWGDVLREQKSDETNYRYGYQGNFSERDEETHWSHFELREYDPIVGRWTSKDPADQYYSPYVAMGNNPVSGVDPDGGWVKGAGLFNNFFKSDAKIYSQMAADQANANVGVLGMTYSAQKINGQWGVYGEANSFSLIEGSNVKIITFQAINSDGSLGEFSNGGILWAPSPGTIEFDPMTQLTLGFALGLRSAAAATEIAGEASGITGGAIRVQQFGATWESASLEKAIAVHAGPNATSWVSKTGKIIFENPVTGRQVVVDPAGYFRIFQPKSIGSTKGVYLDMLGKVPSPATFVKGGAIKNVPLTGGPLQQATHFMIK